MLKLTAIVSLMLIGSTLWAASLSCDSCGSECASACGTRHFRSCCFNYLRKKRGNDNFKTWFQTPHSGKPELHNSEPKPQLPLYFIENIPEPWMSGVPGESKPYLFDDTVDNHIQVVYDA